MAPAVVYIRVTDPQAELVQPRQAREAAALRAHRSRCSWRTPSVLLCGEVMCNNRLKVHRSIVADASFLSTSTGLVHVMSSDSRDAGRLDNISSACSVSNLLAR